MFAGLGLHSHTGGLCHVCRWEFNPAPCHFPREGGERRYPPVREHCGCVAPHDARTHHGNTGIPHPLPHLQVRSQGSRHRRTVRYLSVDEQGCGCSTQNHLGSYHPRLGHLCAPNGHCEAKAVIFEGGDEGDSHQGRGSPKAFFPTEVPPKHLNHNGHRGGARVPTPDPRGQGSEVVKQSKRRDSVRDQIRQVVMDLEDVLGGLKQVHVEMKEVGGASGEEHNVCDSVSYLLRATTADLFRKLLWQAATFWPEQ